MWTVQVRELHSLQRPLTSYHPVCMCLSASVSVHLSDLELKAEFNVQSVSNC